MHQLASLSLPVSFIIMLVIGIALVTSFILLAKLFNLYLPRTTFGVPVAPFVGVPIMAWALSLGFVAADIWSLNTKAENWASQERSAISRLVAAADPQALNSPALMQAVYSYTVNSTEYEWHASANSEPSKKVDDALQAILAEITRVSFSDLPIALVEKTIYDFGLLQDARSNRLGIGAHSSNQLKWYLLFTLTFISLVNIALIHTEQPASARTAIIVFVFAATSSMWVLVLQANPYMGVERIKASEVNSYNFMTFNQGN